MPGEKEFAAETARTAELLQDQRTAGGNDLVESFFSIDIPEELWHYTNLDGLEGILTTGKVWATDARYTTDPSEFVHARELALGYLSGWHAKTDEDKALKEACTAIIETEFATGVLSSMGTEVFVASFSAAKDAKSQWTDYADQGRGVSIAFDLRRVRPPQHHRLAVTFAPCIYVRKEVERLVEAALGHLVRTARQQHQNVSNPLWIKQKLKDWQFVDTLYGKSFKESELLTCIREDYMEQLRVALTLLKFDLLRLASHCKHRYFAEEREWRLSLPHTKGTPLTHIAIKHRGLENNIPYVAHDLFQIERLPITQIMLGPRCEEVARVERLLIENGYKIPLVISEAPIRTSNSI